MTSSHPSQSVSRRGFLRALLAVGGVAAGGSLLAACQQAAQPAAPAATTAPPQATSGGAAKPAATTAPKPAQAGGQIVAAMQYDSSIRDPATLTSVGDQQEMGNVFDGLVRYKLGTTEIEPALAASWEMADGGKKVTFKLRPGVKFHDGTPLSSADVKFSIARIQDPATKSSWAGLYKGVTSVETPDDQTVVLNLSAPDPSLLVTLAGASGWVVPEKGVKEQGDKFFDRPVGTGAFKFERWTPGTELVLARNPDWWGGAPKLERIVYKPIPDPSTMYAAFEAGSVDIIQVTDPDKYEKYTKESDKYTISEKAGLITRFFGMNSRAAPFDKQAVREAVLYAVNRQALVDGLFKGMSEIATQAVAPGVDANVDGLSQRAYDPGKAQQLLAQAGLPNGFSFQFYVPNIDRFTKPATVIQEDLKAVGINAEIKVLEASSLLAAIGNGEAPMFILSRGQEPTADRLLYTWFASASFPPGQNWAYVESKEVDGWIDEFRQTGDLARRKELSKKIQQVVLDGAYYGFLDHEKQIYAMQKRVQGYVTDPFRSMKMYSVSVSQ